MAVLAICNFDFGGQPLIENWGGNPAQTVTAMPIAQLPNGQVTGLATNYFDPSLMDTRGSGKFFSVPSFQAILQPRAVGNLQYGANIRYNMPDRENLGIPCNPLTFGDMAKESYVPGQQQPQPVKENYGCGTGGCGGSDGLACGKGGYGIGHAISPDSTDLPAGYTNGNYMDVYNSLPAVSSWRSKPCTDDLTASATLPIGTMTTMDPEGNIQQAVVMNRLMNTNMKSRKVQGADFIRGDLMITPCVGEWFNVHPTINTDLRAGAMQVLNGNGESNAKLMELLVNASGGARTTFGGVNLAESQNVNLTPQLKSSLTQGANTVQVTSFP